MTTNEVAEEVGGDTVQRYLDRVRDAWDAGDAARYAAEFTADASYVIFLGDVLLGRAVIERTHHEVFTRWQRGTRMVVHPIDVRVLDESTAVATTVGGIGTGTGTGTGETIEFDKFQTYVLRRESGRWRCAAFQNTEMSTRARQRYATAAG